jgi:hypothetical protein
MDDNEAVKLVERLFRLEARVAELEKRHSTREVISQVRGLEQHSVRRLEVLEARTAGLEGRIDGLARSGLLDKNFWRRVVVFAGYLLLATALLLLLILLVLWGLMLLDSLFLMRFPFTLGSA